MLMRTAYGCFLAAALLLTACSVSSAQSWTTHQDPSGFSLEVPRSWRVSADEGRITAAGPNAERVTIYPLRVEGQLDANRARHLMVGISGQLSPGQRWAVPRGGWQFGPNGVRAVGADERELRETTALWWANTNQGATGFFYAVAAPPARFQAMEPVFARVLSSFRVTRADAQAGGGGGEQPGRGADPLAGLRFQSWTDPVETAFSVEVPAGWNVWGGLRRNGAVARREEIVLQSPDGVVVRVGDGNLPTQNIEPNPTLDGLGTHEGMMYPGTNSPVRRFMPPLHSAAEYIRNNVARSCGNVQPLRQRERPDHVRSLAAQGLLTGREQLDAGEVIFTCQQGRQPFVGYLFVETTRSVNPGVGNLWNVSKLFGFLAPVERATQADAVLQRVQASFRMNPQWWYANVGADMRILQNFQRAREYSAQLQQQTAAYRQQVWGVNAEQTQDVLRGTTRVVDPETGEAYKVTHTSNYYWIDTTHEVIAGTNIPYKPLWDFREMVQTYR